MTLSTEEKIEILKARNDELKSGLSDTKLDVQYLEARNEDLQAEKAKLSAEIKKLMAEDCCHTGYRATMCILLL